MAKSPPETLDVVRDIVRTHLQGQDARVWLFGSWAHGEQSRTSDIDLAVEGAPPEALTNLREALEASTVPFPVDVVDLDHADQVIVDKVKKEGVPWTVC